MMIRLIEYYTLNVIKKEFPFLGTNFPINRNFLNHVRLFKSDCKIDNVDIFIAFPIFIFSHIFTYCMLRITIRTNLCVVRGSPGISLHFANIMIFHTYYAEIITRIISSKFDLSIISNHELLRFVHFTFTIGHLIQSFTTMTPLYYSLDVSEE